MACCTSCAAGAENAGAEATNTNTSPGSWNLVTPEVMQRLYPPRNRPPRVEGQPGRAPAVAVAAPPWLWVVAAVVLLILLGKRG